MTEFMLNYSKKVGDDIITVRSNDSVADLLDNMALLMAEATSRNFVKDPDAPEYDEFEAGSLYAEKAVKDGVEKVYWKVSGVEGNFPKWPVTIWPEVLEAAGFKMDKLEVGKNYPLPGVVAKYKKNEAGNPQKVIELQKPSKPTDDALPF